MTFKQRIQQRIAELGNAIAALQQDMSADSTLSEDYVPTNPPAEGIFFGTNGATGTTLTVVGNTVKNVAARAVVAVEGWSGKVEDYASAADYCDASLMNFNTGERDNWDAGMCKMAVIKPGGTALVEEGVRAAAKAFSSIEKPNGVSDDEWKSQRKKAAKKIIAAFNEMGETAPDAVYKAAGKTPPKRTIAFVQLFAQVQQQLELLNQAAYRPDGYGGMAINWDEYWQGMDVYYDDDGSVFLLAQRASKLYRLPIDVEGDEVVLGAPEEIVLSARANESSFTVTRTTDGKIRWFAIASAAVLNRVNSIDSTELFDNFIKRAQATGVYPQLSFYHHKEHINLGNADWLGRSDYLYLASGVAADSPDGRAAMQALERDATDTEWGASIGFFPIGEPDMLEVARDVFIPVYTDGINDEISIVREKDAASYYTRMGTEGGKFMRKQEKDALVLMFGQARADEMEAQIDGQNRSIVAEDRIRREGNATAAAATTASATVETVTAPAATTEAAVATATPAASVPATTVIEIPESALAGVSEAVLAALQPLLQGFQTGLDAIAPRLDALEAAQRSMDEETNTRLAALEQEEGEKKQTWLQDLPAATSQRQVVIVRPSQSRKPSGTEAEQAPATPMSDVAAQTVAKMNTRRQNAPAN